MTIDSCAGDAKNAHLLGLDGAAERLRLFKADLLHYGSLAAAIAGCDGVFHVACPVPDYALTDPEAPFARLFSPIGAISIYQRQTVTVRLHMLLLQVELLAPAVAGTMNVLRACSEAEVKRVVVVSSLSAVMIKPEWGECKVMDEGCWSDVDLCRTTEVTNELEPFACMSSRKFDINNVLVLPMFHLYI
jgi:nucleoside-diphosphate-sugar epimerase